MVQITVAFAPPIILMIEINFGRGFPLLPQLEKVNVSLCGSVYIHLIGTNFLLHVCTFRFFFIYIFHFEPHFFLVSLNQFAAFSLSLHFLVIRTKAKRTWHHSQQKRKIDWIYSFRFISFRVYFWLFHTTIYLAEIPCQGFMHDFVDFWPIANSSFTISQSQAFWWYKRF